MTEKKVPVCEICRKPAARGIRNIKRRDNFITGLVERKPRGLAHYFCDEHVRESIEINVTMFPSYRLLDDDM